MKKLLIIPTLLLSILSTYAQTTAIPDANFEQALINLGLDSGPINGNVPTPNIDTLTALSISSQNISDLTGIEDFDALTYLNCTNNQLTSLDLSQNPLLSILSCQFNQLTNLNVTQNDSLSNLNIWGNNLTTLDISQNTILSQLTAPQNNLSSLNVAQNASLVYLTLWKNSLIELDLTQNINLITLMIDSNQLTCLNINNNNNSNMTLFSAIGNSNLQCIEVDNVTYSTSNWTSIDAGASFSTSCPNPCLVSLDENSNKSTLMIYPNPTSGQLSISLEEAKTGVLRVLNSLGQVVLEDTFDGVTELNIALDGPAGIYFLQIEFDGQVITKKVVKE